MKKVKNKRLLAAVVAAAMAVTAIPAGLTAFAAEPEENGETGVPVLGNHREAPPEYYLSSGWIGGQEVLYPDGTLSIVSVDGAQTVASDVKEYVSVLPVVRDNNYATKQIYGTNYLTLDDSSKLWDWSCDVESGKVEKSLVTEKVSDFEGSIALLENGDVVRTYEPNEVMLSDVEEISENEFVAFALEKDGTLWKYDYGECMGGMTADNQFVKIADGVTGFFDGCFIKDGAIYTFIPSTGKSLLSDDVFKVASFVPDKMWGEDYWDCYAVKGHTLYSLRPAFDEEIVITEDFQRGILRGDNILIGYVDSVGVAHYFDGRETKLPFVGNEIKKIDESFMLTVDGNLWPMNTADVLSDSNAKVESKSILSNVADYSANGYIGFYAVCTDGTLWLYKSNDGSLTQLDGESSVVPTDPTEPTDPTDPSTDGSKPADDGETTTAAGSGNGSGNAGNPSTGDSMIVISAGAAALAAAGALVLLRKKAR